MKWITTLCASVLLASTVYADGRCSQFGCVGPSYSSSYAVPYVQHYATPYVQQQVVPYVAPTVQQRQYAAPVDWRIKLLELSQERQRYAQQLQQILQDQADFDASVRMLGFNAAGVGTASTPNGYGFSSVFKHYGTLPTTQGSTVYGYNQIADVYGNVDLGGIYQQALRLRGDSRNLEAQGDAGTTDLVKTLGDRAAAIAEIQAKAAAAAQVLAAASAANSTTVHTQTFGQAGGGAPASGPSIKALVAPDASTASSTKTTGDNILTLAQTVMTARCVMCHSAVKKSGNLDLTDIAKLTPAQGAAVLDRVRHPDPSKRMPLKPDGTPGVPLPIEELGILFTAAYGK